MSELLTKMDSGLKTKWLKALRSGEYKKGKQYLCSVHCKKDGSDGKTTYCCLGVLASCLGTPKVDLLEKAFLDEIELSVEGLPTSVQKHLAMSNDGNWKYIGLPEEEEALLKETNYTKIPRKGTFKTIADWIEKNL